MTNKIFVFLVITFTVFVLTILKFDGSSMLWVVNTKLLSPEIESPGPTVSSYYNVANIVTQIKFDYLNTVLKWLDDAARKTVDRWKVVIGFKTVFLPSASPKLTLSQAYQLLGPNSIFTTLKKSPRKKNFESGCESHKVAENVGKKNDQINDQNTIYVTDLEATKKINNKSMSSDKVVNEEPSLVEPDDSNNNKKWMKQKVMSIRFK